MLLFALVVQRFGCGAGLGSDRQRHHLEFVHLKHTPILVLTSVSKPRPSSTVRDC